MIVVPAAGLGFLVVFLVGAGVTWVVLAYSAGRDRGGSASRASTPHGAGPGHLTDEDIEHASIAVGVLCVVLMIGSFFIMPREWFTIVWGVLTVLGILFGLSTFLINEPSSAAQWRTKGEPSSSARGAAWERQDEPRSSGATPPPPPASRPKNPATTASPAPPPVREDYYRNLLAKARYDKRLADRLIEYERTRSPHASWEDLCKNAVDRWERSKR